MGGTGGTPRTAAVRRWARPLAALVGAASFVLLLTLHFDARRDRDAAADADRALRGELSATESRIGELGVERLHLAGRHAVARRDLDAARERLETLRTDEAATSEQLDERMEERGETEAELGVVAAGVTEATAQSTSNAALLAALDECLDGATEVANALAVGDTLRAYFAATAVDKACATVDEAIS